MTTAGVGAAVVAFLVAGAAMTLLAFGAAALVAVGQEGVAGRVARAAPVMKQWAGWVLVLVGVWLMATSLFAGWFARLFPV